MTTELEKNLAREMAQIADAVDVPPRPSLPAEAVTARPAGRWVPLLAAAAIVLIFGGAAALVLGQRSPDVPQPAPAPSITPTDDPKPDAREPLPDGPPSVPYILDGGLYVDGTRIPGSWASGSLDTHDGVWLAADVDGSWWWGGPGVEASPIDAQIDQAPALSPGGDYVAYVDSSTDPARVTGFDTQPAGEGLGPSPFQVPRDEDGIALAVRAVTDEGDIIVQGTRTSLMWRSTFEDQQTVIDLSRTSPDQVVLDNTSAGLVVVNGTEGATDATGTAPYLAGLGDDGALTSVQALPTYDALSVSPGGTWLLYSPAGTLGGEVAAVDSLRAQRAEVETELIAPDGFGFASGTWIWEDDTSLVVTLLPDGASDQSGARMGRCVLETDSCFLIEAPVSEGADPTATATAPGAGRESYTVEAALYAVIEAAAQGERSALIDQGIIADPDWDQMVAFADGRGGRVLPDCRNNGSGTEDCEMSLDVDPSTPYYAILEPTDNAYGWRVTYLGIGGA